MVDVTIIGKTRLRILESDAILTCPVWHSNLGKMKHNEVIGKHRVDVSFPCGSSFRKTARDLLSEAEVVAYSTVHDSPEF